MLDTKDNLLEQRLEELRVKSRVFESGAKRDTSNGKPNVHDLQGYKMLRFGYNMELGEQNYGESNYLKGIPDNAAKESLARHYAKYITGMVDEDHLSAMLFNIQLLMLNEQSKGITTNHYYNQLQIEKQKRSSTISETKESSSKTN